MCPRHDGRTQPSASRHRGCVHGARRCVDQRFSSFHRTSRACLAFQPAHEQRTPTDRPTVRRALYALVVRDGRPSLASGVTPPTPKRHGEPRAPEVQGSPGLARFAKGDRCSREARNSPRPRPSSAVSESANEGRRRSNGHKAAGTNTSRKRLSVPGQRRGGGLLDARSVHGIETARRTYRCDVAQLEERRPHKLEVVGSIPTVATNGIAQTVRAPG